MSCLCLAKHLTSCGATRINSQGTARGQPGSQSLQPLSSRYRKPGLGPSPGLMTPASLCLPEPGYYKDGEFGIRLEDVALVVEAKTKVNCHQDGLEVWAAC